jgi:hypothetical protein
MICPSKTVIAPRGSDAGPSSTSSNSSAIRIQRAVFSFGGVSFTISSSSAIVSGAVAFVDLSRASPLPPAKLRSALRNSLRIACERVGFGSDCGEIQASTLSWISPSSPRDTAGVFPVDFGARFLRIAGIANLAAPRAGATPGAALLRDGSKHKPPRAQELSRTPGITPPRFNREKRWARLGVPGYPIRLCRAASQRTDFF